MDGNKQVNLYIRGNLICSCISASCGGGGELLSLCGNEDLTGFDISRAIIIDGDVHVESFNTGGMTVVVLGNIVAKEVGNGK